MKSLQKLSPLGQAVRVLYALEEELYRLDASEKGWTFFFRLLWSFDRVAHASYRESLLLRIAPECLLEAPYSVEEYVEPPRAWCFTRDDFLRYSEDEWLNLSGDALTARLPQNEFGFLHPDNPSLLGITNQTCDRLSALYGRCPPRCLELADGVLLAVSDFILSVQEGKPGAGAELEQAVMALVPLPPAAPFAVYRPAFLDPLFFLGKARPGQELSLPQLFL